MEQDRELRLEAVDFVDEWRRLTGHPGGGILVWDVGQRRPRPDRPDPCRRVG
ncbi:hypothetical protein [Arsenicicoccus cauae]|uniref:hypothetical protein n=1 Tax=Arsenicicoccus cauae TaxID=2663847 RepID=UPI001E4F9F39|nr:hypothetical protein [Arsenicicoccus cauae]